MKVPIVSLLSTALLLGGCGVFKSRDIPYQESVNQPPLQVPEGLDRPPVDDALRIPEAGTAASRDIRIVDQPVVGGDTVTSGGDLVLADSREGAWRRVGVALARLGDDVSVVDSDETEGRYRVEIVTRRQSGGFLRKLFRRSGGASERVIVQLDSVGDGVRVSTVETGIAARTLLERLRRRLI